ncbi:hypothetical protein I4U23_023243 [Adineta vaga]|nr:hypothetical protein I4U23_023243 [Adineta vaga]
MTLLTSEKQEKIIDISSLQAIEMAKKHKMKWFIGLQIFTVMFIVLIIGILYLTMYPNMTITQNVASNICINPPKTKENIVSLYALDPLARTFGFDEGKYGHIILNWTVYNQGSDIDFNTYNKGNFTVGIEGGRIGIIIDLGSSADLQRRYKYKETVGNGQGFASIHRQNAILLIRSSDLYNNTFQSMKESNELFQQGKSGANMAVQLGHIYILRITDRFTPHFESIVKMLVISYRPNESVTIRWEVIT